MSTGAIQVRPAQPDANSIESLLLSGDMNKLTPSQRVDYYMRVCDSLGLNPYTQPFDFIMLQGKLKFYATKACTEQLRKINGVSLVVVSREVVEGCFVVTARATDKSGRTDESLGAVPIDGLKGETRSNAMMKAETKAKRRVTLSICGLGLLDESETESVPGAVKVPQAAVAQAVQRAAVDVEATPVPKGETATSERRSTGAHAAKSTAQDVTTSSARPNDGQPQPDETTPGTPDVGEAASYDEQQSVRAAAKKLGWAPQRAGAWLKKHFGVPTTGALSKQQAADVLMCLLSAAKGEQAYRDTLAVLVVEGRAKA